MCPRINKIVFTLPEAMVEFSGEKLNLGAGQNPLNIFKYIFVCKVNYKTFSPQSKVNKSPIANHATTLCKECEIKSLTTQALSQL